MAKEKTGGNGRASGRPDVRPGHGKFAVLGLGNFGTTVAQQLEELGNEVLAVDGDEERVNTLAEEFTHIVSADVRDERALEELGLGDFDAAVVAIGENLESNILCTLGLKHLGVPRVWVKAKSPAHHRILSKLGADRIVHPEFEIGVRVAYSLNYPFVLDYISLGSDYFVVELALSETVTDSTVDDLELEKRFGIELLALKRGDELIREEKTVTALREGDRLVVVGKQVHLRALADIL